MTDSSLRILHVVNRVNETGDGIANVCIDLACQQASDGRTVGLACEESGFVGLATQHGVRHFPLSLRARGPWGVLRAVHHMRQLYRTFQPTVVHTHTLTATVVARLASVPSRIPVVATVHNEYQRGVVVMGAADRVVGVSRAVSQAMVGRGIPPRRVSTVHNGTVGSVRRRPAHMDAAPPQASVSIVAVGAVSERKGADVLLQAFLDLAELHPDCELYFVGNLDWPAVLEDAQRSPHAARIHFEGFSPQPQVYLRAATVFVLASRRDPFPLVLLEALEAGVPIVATDVDGIPEALDNGEAGRIVPSGSSSELAAAIESLLSSRAERERMAAAALRRSAAFSVKKMTDGYERVYDELRRAGAASRRRGADR